VRCIDCCLSVLLGVCCWSVLLYADGVLSLFATLDNNATGVVFGENWSRKDETFYYIDQRREVQGHFAETRQATSLSLHLFTSI
jgi:hypothetical protein